MFTVFLVIQILITLALVGIIVVQRADTDGLGGMGGGGGGNALMTGRGAANLMTRTTATLATLFMLNSLWLAIMASNMHGKTSLADQIAAEGVLSPVPSADSEITGDKAADAPAAEAPAKEAPAQVPASTVPTP